jgi:flagellin-like protein
MWKDKKGISPIVGVILVVAMTVLLAAIAWTYLSGMSTPAGKIYKVSLKVERNQNNIVVTILGGPDVSKLTRVEVSTDGGANYQDLCNNNGGNNCGVGSTGSFDDNGANPARVIVRATFNDGTQQIIYDNYV